MKALTDDRKYNLERKRITSEERKKQDLAMKQITSYLYSAVVGSINRAFDKYSF